VLEWPNCAKGRATVTGDTLRVRGAPKTGAILGHLEQGEVVTVWAVEGDWAVVQTDDGRLTGWASMAYLTPIGELNA
jgi:uncharacterized protein YgiM (DUF1202 family)